MAADHSNVHLVEAIDDVMLQTLSLARDLTEADADLPTDCPGWTVRDVLAHMVGVEAVLQGAPQPAV
ncbi:MAG: maleylpyruvate isomerase N-terminal domain-containing protein, partial [Ilumatobacter fluminis]